MTRKEWLRKKIHKKQYTLQRVRILFMRFVRFILCVACARLMYSCACDFIRLGGYNHQRDLSFSNSPEISQGSPCGLAVREVDVAEMRS